MRYFNVPADFDNKTIDKYVELNNKYEQSKIIETYGQITIGNYFGSGRIPEVLPKVNFLDLAGYINYSKKRGIEFNYTINAFNMGNMEFTEEGILELREFLDALHVAGVSSLTISLPSLIELVKYLGYDFKIKASTMCGITTANKALCYKEMGVDRIVVDESLNRKFSVLKRISKVFEDGVEVIVNPICYPDCIYRMYHYNQIASQSLESANEMSGKYFASRCIGKQAEDECNVLKMSWIRPEDLKYYTAIGINYFKIQGRHTILQGDPIRTLECYFKESFEGNLMELLYIFAPGYPIAYIDNNKLHGFIKGFYEDENYCKNDCLNCNRCKVFAEKCIDLDKTSQGIKAFCEIGRHMHDEFKNLVDRLKSHPVNGVRRKS